MDHRIDLFTLMLAHITSFMGFCSVLMDCLQIRDNRMKVRKDGSARASDLMSLQEQENTMHTAAFREYDRLAMWERSVLAVLVLQLLGVSAVGLSGEVSFSSPVPLEVSEVLPMRLRALELCRRLCGFARRCIRPGESKRFRACSPDRIRSESQAGAEEGLDN